MTIRDLLKNRDAFAWALMMSSLAAHVFDEVITDFLPFYNQLVFDMRERFGFFPMPTFSYELWLGGLILAILIGFAAVPLVYRGGLRIRIITTVLGILMTANALGHLLGSVYTGRILPGFTSSFLLLATAIYVVVRGFVGFQSRTAGRDADR